MANNKKRVPNFAIPDTSDRGSTSAGPFGNFSFRFVTGKHAAVSVNSSSDSSVPGESHQFPVYPYGRYSHPDYDSDTSSVVLPLNVAKPSPDVDPTEYYKHLPSEWTDEQKTRQLLVWLMEREANLESSPETHITAEAKRARLVAYTLKQKMITDMKEGRVNVSCYNRPDHMEEVEEKENPINVANAEKLEALSKAHETIRNEIETWKEVTGHVYQAHAHAIDAIPTDTVIPYEDMDVDWMLQHVDEYQQQFYKKYCCAAPPTTTTTTTTTTTAKEMYTIKDPLPPDVIDSGVTHIRKQLNTMNRFQLEVVTFTKKQKAKMTQTMQEATHYLPESRQHSQRQCMEVLLKDHLSKSSSNNNNNKTP